MDYTQIKLTEAPGFEAAPGVLMRPLFGEGAMLNLVELEPGAVVPRHSHPHEQLGLVTRGLLVLVVDGVEHELGPNEAYVMPSGLEHEGRGGREGATVLDVFQPVRDDYRERVTPPPERA
jgi:quercetin dioxygenase-like cupin family protein